MQAQQLTWITSYIWSIADDVLRDLFVRGKYRDVILPMTVLRRLDAVLEDSKQAVLEMKASLDALGTLIEKLTSPDINLSPEPVRSADGSIRHPGLDNHGMGSIFEELASSTRRTTRRPANTGRRAMPSGSWRD